MPKLTELGVTKLTVNYSGSGDQGSIDEINVEPEEIALPSELKEQVNSLAEELLYAEQGSWGGGTVVQVRLSSIRWQGRLSTNTAGTFTDVNFETKEF